MKIILILLISISLYGEEYINGMERDVSVAANTEIIDTQEETIRDRSTKWKSTIVLAFKYSYSKISYLNFDNFRKAKDHMGVHNFNNDPYLEFYRLIITKNKGTYERISITKYNNPLYERDKK